MQKLLLYCVAVVFLITGTSAQVPRVPEGCTCPDTCSCSVTKGEIDCSGEDLIYIPIELNQCSWPGFTSVNFSGNTIIEVSEYSFSQLHNITHLYLYDNAINFIDRNGFVGLSSLEFLSLDGNHITELNYRVFRPLVSLQRLLLYSNLITSLPIGIFSAQSQLTTLALHNNRLDSLEQAVFDDTLRLESLYLHGNQITDLSNAPFRTVRQLKKLYLNNNRLTRVTRFDFLGLNRVQTLVLSNNDIEDVDLDTFLPMQNLVYLYLDSNRIPEVDRLMFAGPAKLQQLVLSHNRITRISDGAFFRLRVLDTLFINFNLIREITPHTFAGLDSLTKLVLHDNLIPTLYNETFVQSPLLTQLWLYNNEISCLEADTFKGLPRVQIMHLSSNRISYLPPDIFQPCPRIVYLLLTANRLTTITTQPFRHLQDMTQLALSYNPLVYIGEGTFDHTSSLYFFQWHEAGSSYLRCDCSALWLYRWVNSHRLQTSVLCNEPAQFQGRDIRALQEASFGCNSVVLKVDVNADCDNHLVTAGDCLRLICSSAPQTDVTWHRADGQPIRSVQHSCDAQSPCAAGAGGDGVMVVEGVTVDDAGYYICTASFQNATVSKICFVSIGEAPELIEGPNDVYLVHPGPAVRFSMVFTGSPHPSVQWYHIREGGGEVAVRETGVTSRYVVSKDGSLVILDSQLEDVGTYRAIISNSIGELTVEAALEIYYELPCRRGCFNGGTCYTLPVCYCTQQYEGDQCQNYIGPPTEFPPDFEPSSGSGDDFLQYGDDEDFAVEKKRSVKTKQHANNGYGGHSEELAKERLHRMIEEEATFSIKLDQAREFARSHKQKSAALSKSVSFSSEPGLSSPPIEELPSPRHVISDSNHDRSTLLYPGNPLPLPTREELRA